MNELDNSKRPLPKDIFATRTAQCICVSDNGVVALWSLVLGP